MSRDNDWNSMIPHLGKLVEVTNIAPEIKMFGVELLDGETADFADYHPGQFAFVSAFGAGEAPFGIASVAGRGSKIEFAVQRHGGVTTALHELDEGDVIGVRGPLGNYFPMDEFEGKNLLVLGGGIGAAPLRPVVHHVFDNRDAYGKMTILMASRTPSLHVFKNEYENWRQMPDTELHLTVDEGDDTWEHHVGLITDLLETVEPNSKDTIAITCGPPIMIFYADKVLEKLGFKPGERYVTLEARMHCGIGKCGRCNLGEILVCVDGPVFSMEEVGGFLESYL